MPRRLFDVKEDDVLAGGKARGLARARAAGLAVPEGWVIGPDDPLDDAELARLPGIFVVRSSATVEDGQDGQAPGIFLSRKDVASTELGEAIRAVRASLDSETARAYLARRALPPARMAVIVQRQIDGIAGTTYTHPPADPASTDLVIEALGSGAAALVERDGLRVHGATGGLTPDTIRRLAEQALRVETVLGGPADVEWVVGEDDQIWIVQARPIVPAPDATPSVQAFRAAVLTLPDAEATWTLDATHNPLPLSPAQIGLVQLVDPRSQRVILGYLYTTPSPQAPPARAIAPAELATVFDLEIAPAFERALARMDPHDLEATLAAYQELYELYTRVLAPALRVAGRAREGSARLPLADFLSPAWDVATPTYGEASPDLARAPHIGVDLAEADDLYFARAQAGVRHALLGVATRWGIPGEDIFFLSLEEARQGAPPADWATRVAAAQAACDRQRLLTPPIQIINGRPIFRAPAYPPHARVFRGQGSGGQARGVVFKLDGGMAVPAGSIVVLPSLIPPMTPLLSEAAALITEHGGLLGHGVALARELGIPCVTGCTGACAGLRAGQTVWVDGERGVVIELTDDKD